MKIKEIAIPIDNAKKMFIDWLKKNYARSINEFNGDSDHDIGSFSYYRNLSCFLNDKYYNVYFKIYEGKILIDYSDDVVDLKDISLLRFKNILKQLEQNVCMSHESAVELLKKAIPDPKEILNIIEGDSNSIYFDYYGNSFKCELNSLFVWEVKNSTLTTNKTTKLINKCLKYQIVINNK
jgi:hypothetical protein